MLLSATGEEDAALYNRGGRCCSLQPGRKMLLSTTGEQNVALYNRGAKCCSLKPGSKMLPLLKSKKKLLPK
jgi:hypothetical protein